MESRTGLGMEDIGSFFTSPPGQKVWIASHRGKYGGGIPENSLEAFDFALACGADIVETDVALLADGGLVLFHDDDIGRATMGSGKIADRTISYMGDTMLRNCFGESCGYPAPRLDEMLVHLKGRCVVNLDRGRHYIERLAQAVQKHGMEDQILFKNPISTSQDLGWLYKDSAFAPIVEKDEEIPTLYQLLERHPGIKTVEVVFKQENSKLIATEFVEDLHSRGIKIWVNSLTQGVEFNINARHDDNHSLQKSPAEGWGWLVERGADIIQTDWPRELLSYLTQIHRRGNYGG